MSKHPARHYVTSVLTLIFFAAIFLSTNFIVSRWESAHLQNVATDIQKAIERDLDYLSAEGDAAAKNPLVATYLLSEDNEKLLAVMLGEKNNRGIGLMEVSDAEGYIIARTHSVNDTGENAFTASPQGRALGGGAESVKSIEVSSYDAHQVLMATARKIYSENTMVGALFANYLLDDTYASGLIAEKLPAEALGTQVIFYVDYYGAYGSSFAGSLKDNVNVYVRSQPQVLRRAHQDQMMSIYGTNYLMRNIPFNGLEGPSTGVLVFTPVLGPFTKILLSALFGAFALIAYAFIRHLRVRHHAHTSP